MKPKNLSLLAVALCVVATSSSALFADDITWNGGGANSNWDTLLNWDVAVPVAGDSLFFGGSTRLANTNNLAADTSFAGITFNPGAGAFTLSGNRITLSGDITNNSSNLQIINNDLILDADRSVTAGTSALRLAGAISGSGGLKKIDAGTTLNLTGGGSNTYTGLTSVEAGRLNLSKSTGFIAVAGDVSITGGGTLTFTGSGSQNQIADTASVTVSGAGSTFNGTASNTTVNSFNETIGSLTVNEGFFNSGSGSWTVTGAVSFDGTVGDTRFTGNSGSQNNFGSLSLTAMTGTTIASGVDSFVVGGASTTRSTLTLGSGGLSLNGSRLVLNGGDSSGQQGSRLVLNGDVSVTGSALSLIQNAAGSFNAPTFELSSTTGSHTRGFGVAAGSELLITTSMSNGAATDAGIAKTGAGILRLRGTNTYTGTTTVSQGILTVESTAALPGFNTSGRFSVASGATLAVYNAVANADVAAMLGTGNFAAGSSLGFDTASANRTYADTLTDTGGGSLGLTKLGGNILRLTADSTYTGVTSILQGTLQLGDNTSTGSIASSSGIEIATGATLQTHRLSGSTFTISQVISGGGGVTTTNAGTTVLAGATSNTYTGTTTVGNNTRLRLDKTGGATAVSGNLSISGGTVQYAASGVQNQIADTSTVTIATDKVLNGTASNVGVTNDITETIGALTVNGGIFNTGNASKWTITGAGTFNGGIFVGNSGAAGANTVFGSLSLTNMNGAGAIITSNVFGIGGNTLTTVRVGAGGLSLDNSSVKLSTGTTGNGSRLILNGDVTTTGTNATGISSFSSTTNARVELSDTSGTHNRTFTVGAEAPLTIAVALNRGAATTAGIIKEGAGVLSLTEVSNYNGDTVVNNGTLNIGAAINSSTNLAVSNSRLQLGAANVLNDMAAMSLTNATFDTAGFSDTLGVLTISGDNFLDLGSIASIMRFGDSSFATWGSTLTILNWSGDALGEGTDRVYFGSGASGLTPEQLSSITFLNPEGYGTGTYSAAFLASGEIIPVIPEPSALLLFGLGASGLFLRRKR